MLLSSNYLRATVEELEVNIDMQVPGEGSRNIKIIALKGSLNSTIWTKVLKYVIVNFLTKTGQNSDTKDNKVKTMCFAKKGGLQMAKIKRRYTDSFKKSSHIF